MASSGKKKTTQITSKLRNELVKYTYTFKLYQL